MLSGTTYWNLTKYKLKPHKTQTFLLGALHTDVLNVDLLKVLLLAARLTTNLLLEERFRLKGFFLDKILHCDATKDTTYSRALLSLI